MIASHGNVVPAFRHRVSLLVGILAVLTGILGMHVITGSHSMHSPAALTAVGTSSAHPSPVMHDTPTVFAEKCSCSDSCASMPTMTVSCTPSGKTGSLSIPRPGEVVFGAISHSSAPGAVHWSYSYRSGSPSPVELSISRT